MNAWEEYVFKLLRVLFGALVLLMTPVYVQSAAAADHPFAIQQTAEFVAGSLRTGNAGPIAALGERAKSTANGLVLAGSSSYQVSGNFVQINVDRIENNSSTRSTGTLLLELWATTSAPARGAAFSGYQLAVSSTLNALQPNFRYNNVVRNPSFTAPPDGTYRIVLVLSEYNPAGCPTSASGYCLSDSVVFSSQVTFGNPPGPSTYTVISQAGSQCYENVPSAAVSELQRNYPGVFQQYSPSITCAALGMPVFAGYSISDASVTAWTPDVYSAQVLCSAGLLTGCTYQPPQPSATAVEYFYPPFGHYFITAGTDEINGLDAGAFPGWVRTGESFKVYTMNTPGSYNVCRFFSTTFAPKSSHFYTAVPSECQHVKGNPNWQFEGERFAMALPDAGGNCPPGLQPLYRFYNDGQGGAPNHRYTIFLTIGAVMTGQGWTPEGVRGCLPV